MMDRVSDAAEPNGAYKCANTSEQIDDGILVPEPPTWEELDMDKMFDEDQYPTMDEIENAKELGMVFNTRDEAYYYFRVYARKKGFAIRKDSTYSSRVSGLLNKQVFVCRRQGKSVLIDDPGRKKRSNVVLRTDCKVLVRVKLQSNRWEITVVHLDHNHALAPSLWLVRFLKCHKQMIECEKRFIEILQSSRVPPRQVMSIFRMLRGNLRAIGFDSKDVTSLKSEESKKHRNRDIDELTILFKERRRKIPRFYYILQNDGEGAVQSVFWTDAMGTTNYKIYGDNISFDTTFSTNVYDMPFSPIVGVDNHGKTILFGCSLLKDQTTKSYEWLFDTFLIANDGKIPETIITDQEQSIVKALDSKFPMSLRRYCFWHIIKLMKQKQYKFLKDRKGLYRELKQAIRDSFTPEEFEAHWREIIDRYNVHDNNGLNFLCNIRNYWGPNFYGGILPFFEYYRAQREHQLTVQRLCRAQRYNCEFLCSLREYT
jgi:hypothetical protein